MLPGHKNHLSYNLPPLQYLSSFLGVPGGWSEWSQWSSCAATCGDTSRIAYRTCDKPAPSHKELYCNGEGNRVEKCNLTPCPIHGNWAAWGDWTPCTICNSEATKTRHRMCTDPAPEFNGRECEGVSKETTLCVISDCPVNGAWSHWNQWTPCSVTCSKGNMARKRSCNNPEPEYGGDSCSGSDTERKACSLTEHCPIHGDWSIWTDWSQCSVSCDSEGVKIRNRSCDNPTPKYDGSMCEGNSTETAKCPADSCKGMLIF